jgi:hypothetical protein
MVENNLLHSLNSQLLLHNVMILNIIEMITSVFLYHVNKQVYQLKQFLNFFIDKSITKKCSS